VWDGDLLQDRLALGRKGNRKDPEQGRRPDPSANREKPGRPAAPNRPRALH
jgi:hypothetical protein